MFTIESVTPAQIADLEKKLLVSGTVSAPDLAKPNEFQIYNKEHGIQASAAYDPATGNLTVNIQRKPLLVPESVIKNGIEEALKS